MGQLTVTRHALLPRDFTNSRVLIMVRPTARLSNLQRYD
jgi:hypothetical protein